MKSKKKSPIKPILKKPVPKPKPRGRAMPVEAEKEKEFEEQEEDEREDEEEIEEDEDEDEEDEMGDQEKQQSSSDYGESYGKSYGGGSGSGTAGDGGGGGGDEQETNQVLGHIIDPKTGFQFYKREDVRKDLVEEVIAQEKYEDEAYDGWIETMQANKEKAAEALSNMKYEPDKIREEAKKANEAAADPKKVEEQSKAIQELRAKLYPQPPGAGAGK